MIYFYGSGEFGFAKFSDVRPFNEFYDELSPSSGHLGKKGKFRALAPKKNMEREKGIAEAKRDAALKNKWGRAKSASSKK